MRRLAFMLLLLPTTHACGSEPAPAASESEAQQAAAAPSPPEPECTEDQQECERWGRPGVCLRARCVLVGACSFDVDCNDSNPCTRETCDRGECRTEQLGDIACTESGAAGTCQSSACVPNPPASCTEVGECEDAAGLCQVPSCVDTHCAFALAPDGTECALSSGVAGVCAAGRCDMPVGDPEGGRRCRTLRTSFGSFEECSQSGLRFRLDPDELARESSRIEERIREGVLYDVFVTLVPLGDGGYNIVVFNRQDREHVQGLVDPSFVAFEVGNYTGRSRWRSRTLQIWLDPYSEGWQISTEGGRRALRRGRAASGLGFLGVVNIRAFRTWLQAAFEPMAAPAPDVASMREPELAATEPTSRAR